MHDSVMYWLKCCYKNNPPEVSSDGLPSLSHANLAPIPLHGYGGPSLNTLAFDAPLSSTMLKRALNKLTGRWKKKFNEGAPKLAKYFAQDVNKRTEAQLKKILKDAGFTVKFTTTKAQRDIMQATVQQNVSLIKSIPTQYHHQIENAVMRSVQTGRDLGALVKDIQKTYKVTRQRAALIARDQNNKATAALTRARHLELGLTEAIWMHSGAGHEPRPTHVANSGKRYDINKGWFDPAVKQFIQPGELINCRCISKPVLPGLSGY